MAETDGKPAAGKPTGVKSDDKLADHVKPADGNNWVARSYESHEGKSK